KMLGFVGMVASAEVGHDAVTLAVVPAGSDLRFSSQISEDVPWETFALYEGFVPIIIFAVSTGHCLQGVIISKVFLILQESFGHILQPCIGCIHAETIGSTGK